MTVIDSQELIAPSLAVASDDERAALSELTAIERVWYAEHTRFATNSDITLAATMGQLAFVGVNSDIAPIARLRNPAKNTEHPPYLLPGSLEAYRAYGRLWRQELQERGIDDERLRLAATSFVRSESIQARMSSDPTKLAEPESTHCAGGPWDIDAWEYYWIDDDGAIKKVITNQRDPQALQEIADILGSTPTPVASIPHNPEVIHAATDVVDRLHYAGLVNRILEFASSPNQCMHISPNPEVEPSEWRDLANGITEL